MSKYFSQMGFWGRLFVFLSLTSMLLVGSAIVCDIAAVLIFGRDAVAHQEVGVLQFFQACISIGIFLVPTVVFVRLCCDGGLWANLKVDRAPGLVKLAVCLGMMVVSMPMVSWLEDYNLHIRLPESLAGIENWARAREDAANLLVKKLTGSDDIVRLVINIIVLAVVPALCEEMYFRVGMQSHLFEEKTRMGRWWSVVAAAVLFSALHLQFFGFLPRFVLGAMLGMMLAITGNVWYSVCAHFFNNTFAVVAAYKEATGQEIEISAWFQSPWMAVLSAVGCAALMVVLYKIEKNAKKTL